MPSISSTRNRVTRRFEAAREFDELEAGIRSKYGFSGFQLSPTAANFIALAQFIGDLIVLFSVSEIRSDAILVTQTGKGPTSSGIELPYTSGQIGHIIECVMKGPKRTMPDRLNILKSVLLWL